MRKLFTLLFVILFSASIFAAENDKDFITINETVLTFNTDKQIKQMSVFSLVGGCILNQKGTNNEIEISNLPNGFYLLKVFTDKGVLTYKFMKN